MSTTDTPRPADEFNPYAPPEAALGEAPAPAQGSLAELEAVRRRHLSHEASVRSIGSLHYLAAVIVGLMSFGGLFAIATMRRAGRSGQYEVVTAALTYLAMFAFHFGLGRGLNRLQTWARWVEAVLSGLGLAACGVMAALFLGSRVPAMALGPAFGGLIIAYVLYLLASAKGAYVFSPEYRAIIDATPHVKYRTSPLVWFFLLLVLGLIALAFVGSIFGR